jgi:hypothetical protein
MDASRRSLTVCRLFGELPCPLSRTAARFCCLLHFQHRPAGQRGGLVVEEDDAAGFGEWQAGRERPAIERHLLHGLAVGLVVGFEPAGFGEQAAAPSH